jgi:hypothetical protein
MTGVKTAKIYVEKYENAYGKKRKQVMLLKNKETFKLTPTQGFLKLLNERNDFKEFLSGGQNDL